MCPTGTTLHPTRFPVEVTSDFRDAFAVMDADRDGKISGDDLRSFYSSAHGFGDGSDIDDMIKAMIKVADANKDGYVEYDEFEGVLNKGEEVEGKEVMEEVFKVMDKDGDGRLGVEDLKSYLEFAGINVGDDEINGMIMLGGGNVFDGVSFDGFVRILSLHD